MGIIAIILMVGWVVACLISGDYLVLTISLLVYLLAGFGIWLQCRIEDRRAKEFFHRFRWEDETVPVNQKEKTIQEMIETMKELSKNLPTKLK